MALRPKHRREIRDLLRILFDDKVWTHRHTDRLLAVVRAARVDVADEVEKRIAEDLAAERRANLQIRGELLAKMREVEYFREEMRGLHGKIHMLFEALVDAPLAKAAIRDPETGEVVGFDPTLIDDKTAKVALSAANQALKVTGANAPIKQEITSVEGSAFDLLDAIEVEAEEA